jgi:aspartyl/asparaginyl-tRNA synthetase
MICSQYIFLVIEGKKGRDKMKNGQNIDADVELREHILAALKDDARTTEATVDVIGRQSVITLEGTVDSEEARRAAVEIASEQPEVVEVIDDLKVVETQPGEEWIDAPQAAVFDSRVPYIPNVDKDIANK